MKRVLTALLTVALIFACMQTGIYAAAESMDTAALKTAGYNPLYNAIDRSSITGNAGVAASDSIDRIFDDDTATKWCVAYGSGTVTVQWEMISATQVDAYAIATANDSPERTPQAWTFYGSHDGTQWVTLDTVTEGNLPTAFHTLSDIFTLDEPDAYLYYKLEVTQPAATSAYYQFSELVLLETYQDNTDALADMMDLREYVTDDSITTNGEGISTSYNEGIANIFDGDVKTKTCMKPGDTDGSLTVEWATSQGVQVDGYAISTANDSFKRNPSGWVLYGTNDRESEWTVLDTVTDGQIPYIIQTMSPIYPVDNPGEYQYYKIVFSGNFDTTQHLYQFSELTLLQNKEPAYQVISAIDALSGRETVTAARAAYDALTDQQKALVTNLDVLEAAEKALIETEQAADKAAADKVIAKIAALPASVTLAEERAVKEARTAYDSLTDNQKEIVTNLNVLIAAEQTIEDLKNQSAKVNYGNVNGDSEIDAKDALLILQAAVEKITLTEEQTIIANVNGDDDIDAKDALLVLQKAVDKIDKFPVENQ